VGYWAKAIQWYMQEGEVGCTYNFLGCYLVGERSYVMGLNEGGWVVWESGKRSTEAV